MYFVLFEFLKWPLSNKVKSDMYCNSYVKTFSTVVASSTHGDLCLHYIVGQHAMMNIVSSLAYNSRCGTVIFDFDSLWINYLINYGSSLYWPKKTVYQDCFINSP